MRVVAEPTSEWYNSAPVGVFTRGIAVSYLNISSGTYQYNSHTSIPNMVRRNQPRRSRRTVRRNRQSRTTIWQESLKFSVHAGVTVSFNRNNLEFPKDRVATLIGLQLEISTSISAVANPGAGMAQVRVLGLIQNTSNNYGSIWTSGPFMVNSGLVTKKTFSIPMRDQYPMPRSVPDNFTVLALDHLCEVKGADTYLHGVMKLTFRIGAEQLEEVCPALVVEYIKPGTSIDFPDCTSEV